jgi:hypothetical protein
MCRFVWEKRDLLMARSRVLTVESFRSSVFPIVFAAKAVATGMVEDMQVGILQLNHQTLKALASCILC